MESRQLLAANPFFVGAVYIEEDIGSDQHGDTFEITFEGGAEATELQRLEINGDQATPGFGVGDVFFDTRESGLGADKAYPFTVISMQTADPSATVQATIEDGSTLLVLEFTRFRAGDKLVFSIDVDEVETFDPSDTDLTLINEGFDPLTSGVEFQGSLLTASFSAPHYYAAQTKATFRNRYDAELSGTGLDLPADDHNGKRDRSAGAVGRLQQKPLPISIAGTVYLERDLDLRRDAGENGLAGVGLALWMLQDSQYAFTGHTTTTNSAGQYRFGTELDLAPGVYEVRETQPDGLFSVGAIPGTVAGQPTGQTVPNNRDVLTGIAIPLGDQHGIDFDFAEARPAGISGFVYHDRDNDGVRDAGEEGVSGVVVRVVPVDVIVSQAPVSVTTNASGSYSVSGLAPDTYRVVEQAQPAGYLDGLDRAGTVNGQPRGTATNPGDNLEGIFLGGGEAGIEYNFGELVPASISGHVRLTDRYGDCTRTGGTDRGLADVAVVLLDASGRVLAETRTDEHGVYRFGGLRPGSYAVVETTPTGLIDGADHIGTVNGQPVGKTADADKLTDIVLASGHQAVDYDFCEHEPASVSGLVYHDRDNDGVRDAGEEGIGGVQIRLVDDAGRQVAATPTNASGGFEFTGLRAGVYAIVETHPDAWIDGSDRAGTVLGQIVGRATNPGDRIGEVTLYWGDVGVDYLFGEFLYSSIQGNVHLTGPNGDCYMPNGENPPLEGVTVLLLDASGTKLAETTTDAQGNYRFDRLLPGTYTVVEQTPDGLIDGEDHVGTVNGTAVGRLGANDRIVEIALTSGQQAVGYDFCEHEPASLSGLVYHDRDNDGVRDAGEEGIGEVEVRLVDDAGRDVATTRTAASGRFEFNDLRTGVYAIVETHPAAWVDGSDRAGTVGGVVVGSAANPGDRISSVTLLWGDVGVDYLFGEFLYSSIQGNVHLTGPDGDCYMPNGENPPLEGVTVLLLDASGTKLAETKTDAQGDYRFDRLLPGTYTVVEQTPDGLIDGEDHVGTVNGAAVGRLGANDRIVEIALTSGQQAIGYDFCEHEPASLSGLVYHDRDNDGVRDAGEDGIGDVEVRLVDDAGREVAATRTAASGRFEFTGLRAGVYAIVETHPDAWIDGSDRAGTVGGAVVGSAANPGDRISSVRLLWGDVGVDYLFGEFLYSSVQGNVHLTNPDGDCYMPDGANPPLAGVTVLLLDANGTRLAETKTDAQGNYRFDRLLPGSYTVAEQTPDGLIDGDDHVGTVNGITVGQLAGNDRIAEIALSSGQQAVGYDFCEHTPASLSGFVYHDENNNGRFDGSEQPLAGVTIHLVDEPGSLVATVQTDNRGFYEFSGLRAGLYLVREIQPAGYLDGQDAAGQIAGVTTGTAVSAADEIRGIRLRWGDQGVQYNFGELLVGSIEGLVHVDLNGDREFDSDETPIGHVTVELLDADGSVLASTQTDVNGRYRFDQLPPGEYTVREQQPAGYFQGGQRAGSGGGNDSLEDIISEIALRSGQRLVEYNFCEVPPSSLAGTVHLDPNRNGAYDAGETLLQGVTLRLLDATGKVLSTARTNPSGRYLFDNLRPGTYTVEEVQPAEYFTGGQRAGSHGGNAARDNVISEIAVRGGQALVRYDFAELPAGRLSGYVFQDGDTLKTVNGKLPENIWELRDGVRAAGDKPLAGVVLELRNGINGNPINGEMALPGTYPPGPIRTVTDENGFYEFRGLPRGNYAVFEIHPEGYWDGLDTPGTTSGLAINPNSEIDPLVIFRLSKDPQNDAIILIPLGVGAVSEYNNFSELSVEVERIPTPPDPPREFPPPQPPPIIVVPPAPEPPLFVTPAPEPWQFNLNGSGGHPDFTWHLSVIDAGAPRGVGDTVPLDAIVWRTVVFRGVEDWRAQTMDRGHWLLGTVRQDGAGRVVETPKRQFGLSDGVPVVGDWNGDGIDEIGIYHDGHWFLDLNGNGRWDDEDLWANLGDELDLPVTGDWNGDGKDDIGIFGPAWPRDPLALAVEPGLPDLRNRTPPVPKPKNVPPKDEEATDGVRLLRQAADGRTRADVIDHVFRYGAGAHIPVTGDWSGDGIKNIGVFRDGQWHLDVNGDGRWSDGDREFVFGQAGDLPVVGDFDGDGLAEIGVFRHGLWIVDVNHNQQIDSRDLVFALGADGDQPVVGDWNGDGTDDPGVYRSE